MDTHTISNFVILLLVALLYIFWLAETNQEAGLLTWGEIVRTIFKFSLILIGPTVGFVLVAAFLILAEGFWEWFFSVLVLPSTNILFSFLNLGLLVFVLYRILDKKKKSV